MGYSEGNITIFTIKKREVEMPAIKRHKTRYAGVYFLMGTSPAMASQRRYFISGIAKMANRLMRRQEDNTKMI